jgi:uncharacterized HAD superfamily protein
MFIAVDIDEVLAEFMDKLLEYHNDTYGTSFIKEDFISYDFWDVWGGTREEAIVKVKDFFRSRYSDEIVTVEGSLKAIAELRKKHTLTVVTSRYDSVIEHTHSWIKKHYPDSFNGVHFAHYDKNMSKAAICRRLEADVIIDDTTATATECSKIGMHVLLYDRPWNRKLLLQKNMTRVYSWEDILREIERLSSLEPVHVQE